MREAEITQSDDKGPVGTSQNENSEIDDSEDPKGYLCHRVEKESGYCMRAAAGAPFNSLAILSSFSYFAPWHNARKQTSCVDTRPRTSV